MSSVIVPVATIETIEVHPNADALEIAKVLGWQLVVPKQQFAAGDKVVYFPPDTMLPFEVSERFGVTRYLSNGRIRQVRLRGEPSFGLAVRPDEDWDIGENVADYYSATKYEPPLRPSSGDAEKEHPLFLAYTDIENMRNFPTVLSQGETVVVTEKIHGTNSRIGIIEGEWMAGSKAQRRKRPDDEHMSANLYWYPYTITAVRDMLEHLAQSHRQTILYGEVYGKVQSLHYGLANGLGYRAFDLLLDGKFVDYPQFKALCDTWQVPVVPEVAIVEHEIATIRKLSEGKTLLGDAHIREGVVVRPLRERADPKIGRAILKYVSDAYLFADKSDFAEQ